MAFFSAWTHYLKLKNLTRLSTQISSSIKLKLGDLCLRKTSNSIKLETFKIFRPKFGKLVTKLELEFEKWKKLELAMCSNSEF